MARSAVCLSCCAHRNILKLTLSCLVHGDSSGAGGSSCCGHGGHSSRLPPCRGYGGGRWGTLCGPLTPGHAQMKPQPPSQPRRASGSCGLSCPVCLAPEGSWYPLTSPGKFLGGGSKSSGCRGRAEGTEAKAPKTICHGLQSSYTHASELQLRHGLLSSLHRHGPCLSVPLWRSPSCVLVRICPEGPPERPPPLPDGTVKARDEPFGRGELCQGSVVCVMCSRLLCPYLVCFLSSLSVIMS